MGAVLLGLVAFALMEPAAYAAHRWIMHGVGWVLHKSHHQRRAAAFEANDAFPVIFAAVTVLALLAGVEVRAVHFLVAVGVGITLYGAAYSFVHDVYIHGRLGRLPVWRPLERLKEAHAIHHLYGREPYGMLCPVVPRALRERAARTERDPFVRARAA
jgi:beta-carotene 3-hydroxylase